ncbi:MAG: hypothetical protein KatS3mg102_1206 [Planctomycetota bacterium]|nr:MAG: hypothetical protein KatS3mg102_1206 [Planctomycetota bacterium]
MRAAASSGCARAALLVLAPLLLGAAAASARAGGLVAVPAAVPGEPADVPERWALYMHHLHTVTGSWAYREGGAAAAARGLDAEAFRTLRRDLASIGVFAIGTTEHNTLAHAAVLERAGLLPAPAPPYLLLGTEYSGARSGHLSIILPPGARSLPPLVPRDAHAVDAEELRQVIAEAHRAGAFTAINHPFLARFPWPSEQSLGARAIEVDAPTAFGPTLVRNLRWWHERVLAEQRPIVLIAGADFHLVGPLRPRWFRTYLNRVRLEGEPGPAALFAGLLAGRVQIARPLVWQDPAAVPLVLLGVDLDGDGSFAEGRAGALLQLPASCGRVRLQVRVLGGAGCVLALYDEREPAHPAAVAQLEQSDTALAFDKLLAAAAGLSFVRAEVYDPSGRRLVLTNPIYFYRAAGRD